MLLLLSPVANTRSSWAAENSQPVTSDGKCFLVLDELFCIGKAGFNIRLGQLRIVLKEGYQVVKVEGEAL